MNTPLIQVPNALEAEHDLAEIERALERDISITTLPNIQFRVFEGKELSLCNLHQNSQVW